MDNNKLKVFEDDKNIKKNHIGSEPFNGWSFVNSYDENK